MGLRETHKILNVAQNQAGLMQELFTQRRNQDAFLVSFKDHHPQLRFQFLDGGTKCRLCDVTGLGGLAEVSEAANIPKGAAKVCGAWILGLCSMSVLLVVALGLPMHCLDEDGC